VRGNNRGHEARKAHKNCKQQALSCEAVKNEGTRQGTRPATLDLPRAFPLLSTFNSRPSTLDHQLSTFNSRPSTLDLQLSILHPLLAIFHLQLSTLAPGHNPHYLPKARSPEGMNEDLQPVPHYLPHRRYRGKDRTQVPGEGGPEARRAGGP